MFPAAAAEFLQHWPHDAPLRWTPKDFAAQQAFVNAQLVGPSWLDWSTESAAFELCQAQWLGTPLVSAGEHNSVLLAGPVAELLPPTTLFPLAAARLKPGGRLVGIVPCLRDNSPESQLFAQLAAESLWPYTTAEELLELLAEAGLTPDTDATRFVPVPRFNDAVLKDELAFQGFRRIFDTLEAQGYEPLEVGWGELRFTATVTAG